MDPGRENLNRTLTLTLTLTRRALLPVAPSSSRLSTEVVNVSSLSHGSKGAPKVFSMELAPGAGSRPHAAAMNLDITHKKFRKMSRTLGFYEAILPSKHHSPHIIVNSSRNTSVGLLFADRKSMPKFSKESADTCAGTRSTHWSKAVKLTSGHGFLPPACRVNSAWPCAQRVA